MKHLQKFENFRMNEELLGLPKLSEVKSKVKNWIESNKDNPEFQSKLNKLRQEMRKLDPQTQQKLKSLASETPEELKAQVEPEMKSEFETIEESLMINESIDWKNLLSKFFKILGIGIMSSGFITAAWALITMAISGSGYTEMLGSTANQVTGMAMITMLSSLVPMLISILLAPEKE